MKLVRKIRRMLFSWTLPKWKQMMFLFVGLFCLVFVFPNKKCLGGEVLTSILSIHCETAWISRLSFAAVFNSEYLCSINDGWSTWSSKKAWFFSEMGFKFQVCPNLNCISLKHQQQSETEEKYGLLYLLMASQKYFLVPVFSLHSFCLLMCLFSSSWSLIWVTALASDVKTEYCSYYNLWEWYSHRVVQYTTWATLHKGTLRDSTLHPSVCDPCTTTPEVVLTKPIKLMLN